MNGGNEPAIVVRQQHGTQSAGTDKRGLGSAHHPIRLTPLANF
jgi:hypothetical protein